MGFKLSENACKFLVRTARKAIGSKFDENKLITNKQDIPEELDFNSGCFVTLHKNGKLRGCIGNFREDKNIVENVAEMAVQSPFNDMRFPPLTKDELSHVEIEISVLSPMVPVNSFDEIKIGRDGLYISKGIFSGVLLPQVASEYGWNVEEFLKNTCRKAGLPADAYKAADTKVYRFEAFVFSEQDLKE
ncbi:MAG TPA: AmmeMemoRadiSam system protein A [Flexistipes sinusarabici]|uniref:AmmeMemoRadiSam system protein A n=1 Tax=Flexistipes sinusarabici TaxID=2352 RepID=A0A3D5QA58_FLESI|nr:AmmeMemoRadiSam system protein A [Flexistipes sinusarabici]